MATSLFLTDYEKTKRLRPKYGMEHVGVEQVHLTNQGYGPGYEIDLEASRASDSAGLVARRQDSLFVSSPFDAGEDRTGVGMAFPDPEPAPSAGAPAEPDVPDGVDLKTPFEELGPAQQMLRIQHMKEQFIAAYGDTMSAKALKAAVQQFDLRQAEIDRTNVLTRAAANEELMAWVREGNDPNGFPVSKRELISEAGWDAANTVYFQTVAGTGNVTNPMVYNALRQETMRINPATGRLGIVDVNLAEYAAGLSVEDYRKFQDQQAAAQAEAFNLEYQRLTPQPMAAEMYGTVGKAAASVLPVFGGDDENEGYQRLVYQLERWAEVEAARAGREGVIPEQEVRQQARILASTITGGGLSGVQTMAVDFTGRTTSTRDDFDLAAAYEDAAKGKFQINGMTITEARLSRVEARVKEEFGLGIDPALLGLHVLNYLAAEAGNPMGN